MQNFDPAPSDTIRDEIPAFSSLSELNHIVQTGRIPNALLFHGPEGTGRKQAAYFFAKACNCRAERKKPCNICLSCKKINAGMHPDMIIVGPEENKKVITISQIREMGKVIASRANEAAHRMVCIHHAELMNPQAQNALLKMLEEPPGSTFFILTAEQTSPLLPTILSRCRRIDFPAPASRDIKQMLCARYHLDAHSAHIFSGTAGSDLNLALRLAGLAGKIDTETAREKTKNIVPDWKELRPWLIRNVCSLLQGPLHHCAFQGLDLSRLLSARPELVSDSMAVIRTVFRDLCVLEYAPDQIVNLDFFDSFTDISVAHAYPEKLAWMAQFYDTEKRLASNSGTRLTLDRFFLAMSLS